MTSVRYAAILILFYVAAHLNLLHAQTPALVGYWHNWNASSAPYIQLDQVDNRYNVIMVAFAVPVSGTTYNMSFAPYGSTQAQFIGHIQTLKSQGKRVGISIGGGGTTVKINNQTEENTFVSTMLAIINTYGFDAIDLDLESGSLSISGGTIANPTDVHIVRMINAVKTIMSSYRATHSNQKLFLTMAPETAHSIGGQSAWSGVWGAYLPIIHALRDSLDIMMVQLYNSGSMYGANGGIYTQGTADFIVALGEAMIVGFNVDRWSNQAGPFVGLPANKIAIALPACPSAAGGGYTSPAVVKSAIDYLRGTGPKPGTYTRMSPTGYPDLRGMMTWSINWDAVSTCGTAYEYASNYEQIFMSSLPVELVNFDGQYDAERQQTRLDWQVATTENNSHFEVEHSIDGYQFRTLGTVPSAAGVHTYSFVHAHPELGTQHYRLKAMDWDGYATYSNMVTLSVAAPKDLKIYPNPFSSTVFVAMEEEPSGTLLVYDALGQLLITQPIEEATLGLNMDAYPSGVYVVGYVHGASLVKKQVVKM